jgi:hypothetical protein
VYLNHIVPSPQLLRGLCHKLPGNGRGLPHRCRCMSLSVRVAQRGPAAASRPCLVLPAGAW